MAHLKALKFSFCKENAQPHTPGMANQVAILDSDQKRKKGLINNNIYKSSHLEGNFVKSNLGKALRF